MTYESDGYGCRRLQNIVAPGLLLIAFFLEDPIESAIYRPLADLMGLHMITPNNEMAPLPYGLLMLVRLIWNIILWCAITAVLRPSPNSFPIKDERLPSRLSSGLAVGIGAMGLVIVLILVCGAASVAPSRQTTTVAATYGGGWLLLDILGAVGEELYGRATVILVAERILGWKGAVLVSGLMFSLFHLSNPGASPIWLLRLFAQGCLLAYAVYRTGSLWWSVGYHAGWNWVSAPLFGAAGSGYLDEGHVFNFSAQGNVWLTGGAVGPEGSAFAFLGMLSAFLLLILTARRTRSPHAE